MFKGIFRCEEYFKVTCMEMKVVRDIFFSSPGTYKSSELKFEMTHTFLCLQYKNLSSFGNISKNDPIEIPFTLVRSNTSASKKFADLSLFWLPLFHLP